jgi:hypothetical protein
MTMIKRILLSFALLTLLVGPMIGCSQKKETSFSGTLHVNFEPNLAQDLKSMSERAQIIVLGKFEKEYTTYNGARDPRNPKQPGQSALHPANRRTHHP